MYFDDRTVHRHGLDLNPDDLLLLESRKDPVHDAGFSPAIHSSVDCVPIAIAFRQSAPFAAVLSDVQNRVEYLKVGEAHVAALTRKTGLDPSILGFCDLHHPIYNKSLISVNTP